MTKGTVLLLVVALLFTISTSEDAPKLSSLLRSSWGYTPFLLEARFVKEHSPTSCVYAAVCLISVNFCGTMMRVRSGSS